MTDYEAYQNYLAMKLHFGGEYDFHKYNGKVSATLESFEKRKDKFKFVRLSKKLSDPEILDYFLANFIRGKEWIGDFDQKNLIAHKKIVQSLQYFYENDLEKLLTSSHNFDIIFIKYSADVSMPVAIAPPINSFLLLITSYVVAVPKSTIIEGCL